MMKKTFKALQILSGSIMTAGLIILLIGAYYTIIKAGIPFQDAPDDILWIYQINMYIGDVLVKDGAIIFAAGLIFHFIVRAARKSRNPEKQKNSIHELLILLFSGLVFAGSVLAARGIYAQIYGLPFEDLTQYGNSLAPYMLRSLWSRVILTGILLLGAGTIGCAIALIRKPGKNITAADDAEQTVIDKNADHVEQTVIDKNADHVEQTVIDKNTDHAEQNITEYNNDISVSARPKVSRIIGYILLGLLWSGFCFFVWINAVFYGNWHWTDEELIMHEPVTGRIIVFLADAMPILWIAVPAAIAILVFIRKRKRSRNSK